MKTITRQRKEQLALEASGLCRYSGNHDQHVINGMCYECAIRHRKMRSPHIPDWWPVSVHYSKQRHGEMMSGRAWGHEVIVAWFQDEYDAVPVEIYYALFCMGRISSDRLEYYLSVESGELTPPA